MTTARQLPLPRAYRTRISVELKEFFRQRVGVTFTVLFPVLRFLGYAGLTLIAGPALLLALLWPRRLARRGPVRLVRAGLILTAGATLGQLWTQAPAVPLFQPVTLVVSTPAAGTRARARR